MSPFVSHCLSYRESRWALAIHDTGHTPFNYAESHLRLIRRNMAGDVMHAHHRTKLTEVVNMLRAFLKVQGDGRVADVDMLATKLEKTSTSEEVDAVMGLLEGFTSLAIKGSIDPTALASPAAARGASAAALASPVGASLLG
jgi:hypothetical protein